MKNVSLVVLGVWVLFFSLESFGGGYSDAHARFPVEQAINNKDLKAVEKMLTDKKPGEDFAATLLSKAVGDGKHDPVCRTELVKTLIKVGIKPGEALDAEVNIGDYISTAAEVPCPDVVKMLMAVSSSDEVAKAFESYVSHFDEVTSKFARRQVRGRSLTYRMIEEFKGSTTSFMLFRNRIKEDCKVQGEKSLSCMAEKRGDKTVTVFQKNAKRASESMKRRAEQQQSAEQYRQSADYTRDQVCMKQNDLVLNRAVIKEERAIKKTSGVINNIRLYSAGKNITRLEKVIANLKASYKKRTGKILVCP